MPQEGDLAPDFRLPANDGREVTLSSLRGKIVALYFFPKSLTPG
jgi:peroxiredoxin Q/BCP